MLYDGYANTAPKAMWRVLIFGASSGLALVSLISLEGRAAYVAGRIPQLLGDASYSLYLAHFPVIQMMKAVWSPPIVGALERWLWIGCVFGIALAAGLAGHYLIEKPLIRLTRQLGSSGRAELGSSPPRA
jgi:peptidoglycan/LPS O-acetylase OafA/YrhL